MTWVRKLCLPRKRLERSYLMVPVGEGSGLMRWAMLSGMLMVNGEIWGWTGLTGDSGTFLGSFLSLDRAVNVIFILVLGKRKQHLKEGEKNNTEDNVKSVLDADIFPLVK